MIKKLRVAVDHGNRNMKTCHFIFTTGLTEQDKKPARGEKYLKYQGKYYTLSEKRIPYQRDKTQDSRNRFWILTLFAIAMELEQKSQIQPEDVIQVELPIGLPPKHFAELCERYERYFKGDGKVQELCFNDKVYHLCIQNVMAFPQDYAAMMTRMMEIREIPKVVGIDIGGFTSDYLLMRSGRPDMDYCDSLEKGVITMYNDIISSINSEYDMLLEEADIDSIIKGKTQYYEEAVVQAVETMVQNFVTDLLNSIRERGIDTKSTYTVFIGGGAVLLERFLEQADRLGKHTFIRDMKANADGYDLLLENQTREQLLLQEAQGKYPEWNKMSDERLMKALHTLRDEERKLIYQHVFEERTFEEMSRLNGLSEERCKGIYYYAIRKIRKVMGGEN